jgi:hypothetical protein
MNEEGNQFSIDVAAETQSVSSMVDSQDTQPSEFINIVKDIPLPDPITYEPTQVEIKSGVEAQTAKLSGLDFQVKIDAEEAYEKTVSLENQMQEMRGGFKDLYDNIKGGDWLQNTNRDDFEERPLTDPKNLLFESRRDKSSMFPPYS